MGGLFKKKPAAEEAHAEVAVAAPEVVAAPPPEPEPAEELPEIIQGGFALVGHPSGVRSFGFSNDNALVAVATQSNKLHLWDLEARRRVAQLKEIDVIAMSPAGRYLASRTEGLTMIEVASGNELWTLPGEQMVQQHRGHWRVLSARFSADGTTLALSLDELPGPAVFGPLQSLIILYDVRTASQRRLSTHPGARLLGFSPDGLHLALRPLDEPNVAIVVDMKTLKDERRVELTQPVRCAAFLADGRLLCGTDRIVDGQGASSPVIGEVDALVVSPTGGFIVACEGAAWSLWTPDLQPGPRMELAALPQEKKSQANHVLGATFSPDGRWLAAGEVPFTLAHHPSPDLPVYLWQVANL